MTRLKEGWFRGGRERSFQERQTVPRKGAPQGWAQAGALLWPEFRILGRHEGGGSWKGPQGTHPKKLLIFPKEFIPQTSGGH